MGTGVSIRRCNGSHTAVCIVRGAGEAEPCGEELCGEELCALRTLPAGCVGMSARLEHDTLRRSDLARSTLRFPF